MKGRYVFLAFCALAYAGIYILWHKLRQAFGGREKKPLRICMLCAWGVGVAGAMAAYGAFMAGSVIAAILVFAASAAAGAGMIACGFSQTRREAVCRLLRRS